MASAITLTLAEVAEILNPPMTEKQLRQIVQALRWKPDGARHNGRPGKPVATYQAEKLLRLHAALVPFTEGLG